MKLRIKETLAVVLAVLMVITTMPIIAFGAETVVSTQDELATLVSTAPAGDVIKIDTAGTYTVPNITNNITIEAVVDGVVFNCVGSGSIASVKKGATFRNVTFNMGNNNYHGFQHAGLINMDKCTINGLFFSYGDMNFTGCTFVQNTAQYMMWCYAGNVSYKNCVFNGMGKFLNIYNEDNSPNGPWLINVEDCEFNSTVNNKAALNVKATCGQKLLRYDVSVVNCTANGEFPEASGDNESTLLVLSPLIQVDDRSSTYLESYKDYITVSYEGKSIYPLLRPVSIVVEADEDKGITEDIASVVTSNKDVKSFTETGLAEALGEDYKDAEITIRTTLNSVQDKTLVFDVTPYADDIDVSETVKGTDITFRLPLTDEFTTYAKVIHEDEKIYRDVQGNPGSRYIELTVNHFSEFEVTPVSEHPVAVIGDIEYPTLLEAIESAVDGDTVVLLEDLNLNPDVDPDNVPVRYANIVEKNITIDLDNHTVEGSYLYAPFISTNSDLTIANGTIKNNCIDGNYVCGILHNQTGSRTILNNITGIGTGYVINVYSGKVTLNDSTISTDGRNGARCIHMNAGAEVIMNDSILNGYDGVVLNSGDPSVTDVFTMNSGTINAKNMGIQIYGNRKYAFDSNGNDLREAYHEIANLNGGEIKAHLGVFILGKGAEFNMTDGAIIADSTYVGIMGNGTREKGNANNGGTLINVSGGTITGGTGVFHPQAGEINVSGGTIIGDTGIEMRAGDLNVTGGTIIGNDIEYSVWSSSSGNTTGGVGIAVSQHTTKLPINVYISAGNIKGVVAVAEVNPQKNGPDAIAKVSVNIEGGSFETINGGDTVIISTDVKNFISGGKFSNQLPLDYCASDFMPTYEPDENGMFGVDAGDAIVKIERDDVIAYYSTLADAVAGAAEGETIVLIKDTSENIVIKVGVSFDTNEKAYTGQVSAVEGCHILTDGNVYTSQAHIAGEAVREKVKDPSCIKVGSYEEVFYCTECEAELSRETKTINLNPHELADPVIENKIDAGCTVDGSYDEVVYCKNCHTELSRKNLVIKMKGHHLRAVELLEATCDEEGYITSVCTRCEYTQTAIIEAQGHDIVTTETVTCSEEIVRTTFCKRCGEVMDETIELVKCSCFCHANDGIRGFIYTIQNFLWKLFKINQICKCGKVHY